MTQAQVPTVARDYFAQVGIDRQPEHPVIVGEFRTRWTRPSMKKRISGAWARKLRRQGVTHVSLHAGGHTADFRIAELCRSR